MVVGTGRDEYRREVEGLQVSIEVAGHTKYGQ